MKNSKFISKYILIAFLLQSVIQNGFAQYSSQELQAVETKRESQIRSLRDQEIDQIKLTLSRRQPQARKAELYFRLAELYYESYRATFLLEGKVHESRLKKGNALKTIYRGFSKAYLHEGVKACNEILSYKIPYENMDRVYFFLAFNHAELGNKKQSLQYHNELIRRYPNSPLLYESYRAVAENLYEQRKFTDSRNMFQRALRLAPQDSRAGIYVRMGWTYYREKNYNAAIHELKKAVQETNQDKEKFVSLRDEVLRDLALFITERGNVEEAIDYFTQVSSDKNYFAKVMQGLASEFERRGERNKAVQVYEAILKAELNTEDRLQTQVKLIMLYLNSNQLEKAHAVASGVNLVWKGSEDVILASQNIKALVRKTATSEHEKFQKKKDRKSLNIAESYYALYLSKFLGRKEDQAEVNEIRMYLAEVRQALGRSKEASDLYRQVIETKDARYANQAGALWVGSLADALTAEAKNQKGIKRSEPSALELDFVKAVDDYNRLVPESNETREASIRATKVLAGYPQTQIQAERRARALVKSSSNTEQGHEAARLLIQMYLDKIPDPKSSSQKEYASRTSDLNKLTQELTAHAGLMDFDKKSKKDEITKMISEIHSKMKVGRIASFESNKDFSSAAKEYEEFAKTALNQNDAENAYENAIGAYLKENKNLDAERVTFDWYERFPKSKKAEDSLQSLGTKLLIMGDFTRSASVFSLLGIKSKNPDSLETSARIYEALQDRPQALRKYEEYLRNFPSGPNRFRIALKLARLYDLQNQEQRAVQFYEYCAKGDHAFEAECNARLGDLYYRLKNLSKAMEFYQKVASLTKKRKLNFSPFVAYAQYKLAVEREKEARFSPMTLPDEQLKKALTERLSFFQKINPAYLEAVNSGGPWGIAALHRLSQWAYKFSDELDSIVPPAGLDAQGITLFRSKLKEVSLPLRNKALETWRTAYSKANESFILSPALQEIGDALAQAKEKTPFRAQGRFGGLKISGGDENIAHIRNNLINKLNDANLWVSYGNALWKSTSILMAEIAYDRALGIRKNHLHALNNKAVTLFYDQTQEEWIKSQASFDLFKRVYQNNEFHYEARTNHALMLNYYRIFRGTQNLWEQIFVKNKEADVADGLGVALQGLGQLEEAQKQFNLAVSLGARSNRFVHRYHLAAQSSIQDKKGAEQCLIELRKISEKDLQGFEKQSFDELKKDCEKWRT